jgi:quercetin dioxygenase-like cupin family protein
MVAETSDLRVQLLTLAEGQSIPWHCHTRVNDATFCLEGEILIETRAPRATFRPKSGDRCDVPPKRAHITKNVGAGRARFLVVQGVGAFDFVSVG